MKLRILHNTVRLRLSKDDLVQIYDNNEMIDTCNFPHGSLKFGIVLSDTISNEFQSTMLENFLKITLNKDLFDKFYASNEIGLYFSSNDFKITIERDYKCLTVREEDESRLFDNPKSKH